MMKIKQGSTQWKGYALEQLQHRKTVNELKITLLTESVKRYSNSMLTVSQLPLFGLLSKTAVVAKYVSTFIKIVRQVRNVLGKSNDRFA